MCVSDLRTYDGRLRVEIYERYMRDARCAEHIRVYVAESPGSPEPSYQLGQRIFGDFGDAAARRRSGPRPTRSRSG